METSVETAGTENKMPGDIGKIGESRDMLTIVIAGQRFGIPILQVQDVLGETVVTRIPLAPPEVAGSLNLRGRIVTAINVRKRLGLECNTDDAVHMSVVVEHENELYSLIIDEIGDVMRLKNSDFKSTPGTLDPVWREVSSGVYRLDEELLVVLDVPKFLSTVHS
jgi:purine-binding chemotaxis protein CheW